MSSEQEAAAKRRGPAAMPGPGRMMAGGPVEKSLNFKASSKRVLGMLRPERALLSVALLLAVVSVTLSVIGPKILGHATDLILAGVFGKKLPAGVSQADYVAQLRHSGHGDQADLIASMQNVHPGHGIDFNAVGGVLLWVLGIYVVAGLCGIVQARLMNRSLQRAVRRLRTEVESKIAKLPLSYFDQQPRGEVLSRVTNDIDNIGQTLQQTLSQILTSLLTIVGVLGMMFIGNINYVLVAVVGGLRVASGALSIGDVQAFIQYSRQFSQPLTQVASMSNLVQSGVASAERVFELLDAPEQEPDPVNPERPAALEGRVAFEHVAFRYDPAKPLIEDLSLTAEPGHTVAIVGPTGAGKTTLVNLLMRFYEVTGGRITLDGVDVARMSREELRSGIGMVLQDTWLFGGSIADNIAYGRSGATRDEVVAAAKAAHVDRFVRTLPDGYDTVIDDEGTGVSAGEKQLITIARAFLAEPSILVLDEATSSVDTRTEVLIQRAMAKLRTGRTAFVIAHRLSTIRDADTILVMENGAIVEQGSHSELLDADGAYARLYSAQFSQAVAEVD